MNLQDLDSKIDSRLLSPKDENWLAFLEARPESTVFHHPGWLDALADSYGYRPFIIAACENGGRVMAGLPLMEVRSPVTGRRWVSLPFTDYCMPLYQEPEALDQVVRDLAFLYEAGAVPRIEVRWDLPEHPAIQPRRAYYLHVLKLACDASAVMKGFKRTHRQNIGTAENRGVHIERGVELEHVRRFYQMQLETRRRKGLPVQPWKFFAALQKNVLARGLGFVLLAFKDDECLAGGLFLHWQQTLTYKYAASCDQGQECRPNNLLSWTAMRWGCENGMTAFDLGRSGLEDEGLCRFKRGWGAEEQPLTYCTLSAAKPGTGDGKLISRIEPIIRKAPPWVCKAMGELLYRHFG